VLLSGIPFELASRSELLELATLREMPKKEQRFLPGVVSRNAMAMLRDGERLPRYVWPLQDLQHIDAQDGSTQLIGSIDCDEGVELLHPGSDHQIGCCDQRPKRARGLRQVRVAHRDRSETEPK